MVWLCFWSSLQRLSSLLFAITAFVCSVWSWSFSLDTYTYKWNIRIKKDRNNSQDYRWPGFPVMFWTLWLSCFLPVARELSSLILETAPELLLGTQSRFWSHFPRLIIYNAPVIAVQASLDSTTESKTLQETPEKSYYRRNLGRARRVQAMDKAQESIVGGSPGLIFQPLSCMLNTICFLISICLLDIHLMHLIL